MENIFFNGDIPETLSKEEQLKLIKKLSLGDKQARNKLVEHNIRLVIYLVCNFYIYNSINAEELVSIGLVGLMKGIDTFDIKKGIEFSTYVGKCIHNEILMHLRKLKNVKKYELDFSMQMSDYLNSTECVEKKYFDQDLKEEIRNIISTLQPLEQKIVSLYFGFESQMPLNQLEIANIVELSQSQVSRIIKKTLVTVKARLISYNSKEEINDLNLSL